MQDTAAFLRLIAASPADDGPRLVYADWLEERGDPRGTFIRVQCALARLPADHPRRAVLESLETDLFQAHGAAWAHDVAGRVSGFAFRRGFIDELTVRADAFVTHGAALVKSGTVRTVHLLNAAGRAAALARCPHVAKVRELDLCYNRLGDDAARLVSRSPAIRGLERLDLSFNSLSSAAVEALARAGPWPRLRALDLRGNDRLTDRGATALAHAGMPLLTALDLSDNEIGPGGAAAVLNSRALPRLRELGLAGNPLGDGGGHALARSRRFAKLIAATGTVDLGRTGLTPTGLRPLLTGDRLSRVIKLRLDGNRLGDEGLTMVAAAVLPRLRELYFGNNGVTDAGAAALADAPLLRRLRLLDLRDNGVTGGAKIILMQSPYWHWRTVIETEDSRPQFPDATGGDEPTAD